MNRLIRTLAAPLLDAALFCVLIAGGLPFQSSHVASFAAAMALNYLLKVRSTAVAARRTRDFWRYGRLLAVSLMALFLRGGVLGLLTLHWGWPAQVSIIFAVIAAMAVTMPGYSLALSPATRAARPRALAIGLIAYAFALRWVYLGSVELLPEEAYYWNYSRHLDIGYLDHPPMVAWLISLGTAVFGQTEFGVRIGALCCAGIASVFTYRLTRNLFDEASALAAVVLAQVLPFFFLVGLLMTPDAPLTAAWAASLYYLERALVAGRSGAWWRAGLALGMGAISKYSIGLLVPACFAFMLWDGQSRRWWRQWQPYAAALLGLAVFSPVILWNAQHDWVSFAFQTSRRLGDAPRFALHKLLGSVLVLITPTGVLAAAAALVGAKPTAASASTSPGAGAGADAGAGPGADAGAGAGPGADADAGAGADAGADADADADADAGAGAGASRRRLFINLALLCPLAVFAVFSLRHEVKLDWTGAPWVAALPLMGAGMVASGAAGAARRGLRAWIRAAWVPTLATLLLIYGGGLYYLVLGWPGLGYGKHIELVPVGWEELGRSIAEAAAAVRKETGTDPLIVGMDRYAIASELAFYGSRHAPSAVETSSQHLFGGLGLMYELWTPAKLQDGRTLLMVAWDPGEISGAAIESHAERWGPIEDEVLRVNGHVVRHYYHRLAYNYRSEPRP